MLSIHLAYFQIVAGKKINSLFGFSILFIVGYFKNNLVFFTLRKGSSSCSDPTLGKEACSRQNYLHTGHFTGKLNLILDQNCLISILYPRLNWLKTIPFKAVVDTQIFLYLIVGVALPPPGKEFAIMFQVAGQELPAQRLPTLHCIVLTLYHNFKTIPTQRCLSGYGIGWKNPRWEKSDDPTHLIKEGALVTSPVENISLHFFFYQLVLNFVNPCHVTVVKKGSKTFFWY